jgi:hypothetical protein
VPLSPVPVSPVPLSPSPPEPPPVPSPAPPSPGVIISTMKSIIVSMMLSSGSGAVPPSLGGVYGGGIGGM